MKKQRGCAVPAVAQNWLVLSSVEQSFPLLALECAQLGELRTLLSKEKPLCSVGGSWVLTVESVSRN